VFSLDFWIPPEFTYRAKDPKSTEDKLMERLRFENFTEFDQVLHRMHDMIGIRITSFFPSLEIGTIIKVLELHFNVISVKPGQGDLYKGTNIHLKVDNTDCEVQLRGTFEHSLYQVQHKFAYKVKGPPMTVEQDSILASLRQHAFAAEADLAKLLKLRNVPTPRLLSSYEDSDDNEWNEAWKDVIMRRREAVAGSPKQDL